MWILLQTIGKQRGSLSLLGCLGRFVWIKILFAGLVKRVCIGILHSHFAGCWRLADLIVLTNSRRIAAGEMWMMNWNLVMIEVVR